MHNNTKMYKIFGDVTARVYIQKDKQKKVLFSVKDLHEDESIVTPIHQQKPNESRRVWHKVTVALRKQDYREAGIQKRAIEMKQAEIRNQRTEPWVPKYFNPTGSGWIFKDFRPLD